MKLRVCLAVAALLAVADAAFAQQVVSDVVVNSSEGAAVAGATTGEGFYPLPGGPWHSGYYHTMWAKPVPLVVPPTASHQTMWGWGVGNVRIAPIHAQFGPPGWGQPYTGLERWYPTPFWPYDTLQFGVYYIRGPY